MHALEEIWLYVDPGARSSEALRLAVDLAHRAQASLTLVGAVGHPQDPIFDTSFGHDLRRLLREDRVSHLAELERQARAKLPPARVQARLLEGEVPWHTVLEHAVLHEPDLVLIPSDRTRPGEVDTVAQHFFRKCPVPVWAVAPGATAFPRRILAAVDPGLSGSDERRLAREVLASAEGIAGGAPVELHLVHAYELMGEMTIRARFGVATAEEYLERTRKLAQEGIGALLTEASLGSVPTVHLIRGPPSEVVADVAERIAADLVVVGTAARTGLSGFLIGSSAESIIARLARSVAVVKHPAFVSPVRPRAKAA